MEQLTWGNLEVERLEEPVCTVGELDSKGAFLKLEYTLSATQYANGMLRLTNSSSASGR